jgi:hypothetical protein
VVNAAPHDVVPLMMWPPHVAPLLSVRGAPPQPGQLDNPLDQWLVEEYSAQVGGGSRPVHRWGGEQASAVLLRADHHFFLLVTAAHENGYH